MRLDLDQHGLPNWFKALDMCDGSSSKSFWLSPEGLLDVTPLALQFVSCIVIATGRSEIPQHPSAVLVSVTV